jgi:DNA transposition AAA+ family ATPase
MVPLEVRKKVDSFLVRHPNFVRVEREIHNLISLGRSDVEGDCLLVTSQAGTGKTTVRRQIKKAYPKVPASRLVPAQHSPTRILADHVPVLDYEIPSQPRPIAVVQGLLKELGDPTWDKGRFHDCSHRLDYFLEACGTTTIVLDEVQRLVDQAGVVTSEAVFEELKRVHGRYGLNFVFFGLGRIKYIFEQDVQLRDRWSCELRLKNFNCYSYELIEGQAVAVRDEEQFRSWRGVLQALQEQTGLATDMPLSDEDYADRLYFATAGVMRRLKKLLKRGLSILAQEDENDLSTLILAKAYRDIENASLNPFSVTTLDNFPLPPLDDDYELRPSAKQKQAAKAAGKPQASVDAGALVKNALTR